MVWENLHIMNSSWINSFWGGVLGGIAIYLSIGFILGTFGVIRYLAYYFAAGFRWKTIFNTIAVYTFFWGLFLMAFLLGLFGRGINLNKQDYKDLDDYSGI